MDIEKEGLTEEEMEAIAGGNDGSTQNRYDPERCGAATRVIYECVGFLKMCYCDHYRKTELWDGGPLVGKLYDHVCAMGRFNYRGDRYGDPR